MTPEPRPQHPTPAALPNDPVSPSSLGRQPIRVALRVLLIPGVLVLPPLAGATAALGLAAVSARLEVILGGGLLAVLATAYGVIRGGVRLLGGHRLGTHRVVSWAAVSVTCVVAALTVLTVLTPLTSPSTGLLAPQGPGKIWNLPTGSTLAYDHLAAVGRPRATPVVLLHGGPGTPGAGPSSNAWGALTRAGFDVYGYDQVGAGRSERLDDPTEYTVHRQVDDLEAVRLQLGAPQLVLVGSSWGATLAGAYLAEYPERVARVVFVAPGPLWAPAWAAEGESEIWDRLPAERRARADDLTSGSRIIAWSALMAVNPRAAHELVGDAEVDAVFTDLLQLAGSGGTCHPEGELAYQGGRPGFYANQMVPQDELRQPDPRPALRTARTPVLVLRGECDYIRPEVAEEYVDVIPGARLVTVPKAGHLIRYEQPAAYSAAVLDFLTA